MEFYEAFTAYLNAHAGLSALVGDNIFPDFIPQDEDAPAVVYQQISEIPDYTLQGEQGLKEVIYQFTCYSTTSAAAYSVYKQLRAAFKNYQGSLQTYYVQAIFIESVLPKGYDSVTGRHYYEIDYRFNYTEGV